MYYLAQVSEGVVVAVVLLDFPLYSGSLSVLPEEDSAHQAVLLHQRLQGSGCGRPLYRFGKPSVD